MRSPRRPDRASRCIDTHVCGGATALRAAQTATAEASKITVQLPTESPVTGFLSRNLHPSFLNLGDTEVVNCHSTFHQFNMNVPTYERGSSFNPAQRLVDLLRMQACLERVRSLCVCSRRAGAC